MNSVFLKFSWYNHWKSIFSLNRKSNWSYRNNFLIFTTAIVGVYYAKYEGLNTLKSGFLQLRKNQPPTYEVISGAAIALGAILLIIPGFATDTLGFLVIFPLSRKIILSNFKKNIRPTNNKNNFIDGEYEDIEDENDKKL